MQYHPRNYQAHGEDYDLVLDIDDSFRSYQGFDDHYNSEESKFNIGSHKVFQKDLASMLGNTSDINLSPRDSSKIFFDPTFLEILKK